MKKLMGNDELLFIKSYKKIINTIVIYSMIIATFMQIYGHAVEFPEKGKVPAFIVFGDSIVDPGNNNYIATIGRADFPPYGRDFPGGVATGRYSNGKIPSDFFAEELGIKEFVPPYLDPKLNISDLLTGVSFAFGAAGYDPDSAKLANVRTLQDQLNLFRGYIKELKDAVGENTTSTIISKSVYLVCAGSNDITNTYFSLPFARLHYKNVSAYTSAMVNWASSFVQELYALGARRIGVISAPPCGCLPSQRTLHGGLFRSCVKDENDASILFNNKLFTELGSLNQKLVGSRFVYLDIYNPLLDLINNPSQSGFTVVNRGCCGTGNLEVSFLCTRLDPGTCKNASKFIFWDSFHPTEAAYKVIVHEVVQKSIDNFF
ncbi:GDSL esterase/lipase EXL3-like [Chenopodium quinoa]|uniref:GDSL esterase/lipase EXL3-like n=1 Tax=Chenopodium quinoa TaxID=63459 RepID=UPI000B78C9DB|nr:GDSL esterase/lipase EXL3-like [Chenopodium quinoa]